MAAGWRGGDGRLGVAAWRVVGAHHALLYSGGPLLARRGEAAVRTHGRGTSPLSRRHLRAAERGHHAARHLQLRAVAREAGVDRSDAAGEAVGCDVALQEGERGGVGL